MEKHTSKLRFNYLLPDGILLQNKVDLTKVYFYLFIII